MAAKRTTRRKPTMASQADRYALYQKAVQDPDPEVRFIQRIYRRARGRAPVSFREDFCGTAYLATHWVKSRRDRTAIGVDNDPVPLAWGREHVLAPERPSVQNRVTLLQDDVLKVRAPKVDVVGAFNFSYLCFKDRRTLGRYFKSAYRGLADDGVFICDLFGGTDAIIPLEEERRCPGFVYVWEHARYNPITNEILCHIHFRFRDGSQMREAFSYDWRLWTIPEVRELLAEAGFSRTEVWWDPVDEPDYRLTEEEDNQAGWLVYIAAFK